MAYFNDFAKISGVANRRTSLKTLITCFALFIGIVSLIFSPYKSLFAAEYNQSALSPKGKVIVRDGIPHLWGGGEGQHFNISNLILNPNQFNYGIGRESFPALIEPRFESAEKADKWLTDDSRILGVKIGEEVRVYPISLLIRHEVVNDVIGGKPIAAAYCVLADLGAVYNRNYKGDTLTYALSGYTYYASDVWDGRDAFVFWDRDTESLWWPPIGKAVSGPLEGLQLQLLDTQLWTQTTWEEFKLQYPEALVLKRGQAFDPPAQWNLLSEVETASIKSKRYEALPIAPRWGENWGIGFGISDNSSSVNWENFK